MHTVGNTSRESLRDNPFPFSHVLLWKFSLIPFLVFIMCRHSLVVIYRKLTDLISSEPLYFFVKLTYFRSPPGERIRAAPNMAPNVPHSGPPLWPQSHFFPLHAGIGPCLGECLFVLAWIQRASRNNNTKRLVVHVQTFHHTQKTPICPKRPVEGGSLALSRNVSRVVVLLLVSRTFRWHSWNHGYINRLVASMVLLSLLHTHHFSLVKS